MAKDTQPSGDTDNNISQDPTSSRTVFSGAHDYFINNVLPDNIQAHITKIQAPTSYANNRDQTFILVRSGKGKALINGVEYDLKPNTLINLGPFHRYRFLPSKEAPLEIAEARMNSSTYVYMIANPYLKCEQMVVPSQPPVVHLSGLSAQIANQSMDGLLYEAKNKSSDQIHLCFCYMMDFLGIITDQMPKEYFSPTEKIEKKTKTEQKIEKKAKKK